MHWLIAVFYAVWTLRGPIQQVKFCSLCMLGEEAG